ncbi:MAG: hypothetical protein J0I49_17940 [Pseudonocardia sp.]|uniref:hypothetical protein n=1 Tax=Pseudonocardia sp. TaxID=60912 RepID=UPI001AC670D8|nr:hypothetical protein [Pseudonocardia sp.]MBN9099972.1 hypothetical protein [Pseudonocardia sp.]
MSDYHAEQVGLANLVADLGTVVPPDAPTDAARTQALDAAGAEPAAALSGALLRQALGQAAGDGTELDLLRRAAALWQRGTALYADLGSVRADLEGALAAPGVPGAAQRFNDAAMRAQQFVTDLNLVRVDVLAFRSEVLAFPHLPAHPRQDDLPSAQWNWSDLATGRRTDALVRTLWSSAGDTRTRAFALGALASYGTNAVGAAYVGQGVGGPRRLHRYRDRLARRAIGTWLERHDPAATGLAGIRATLDGGPDEALLGFATSALAGTFDVAAAPPVPDLALGYRRVLEHLDLLDGFTVPAPPAVPLSVFAEALYDDPQNPPPTLRPQDVDVVGQDGGGVAVQFGGDPQPGSQQPSSSDNSGNTVCGIIVAILIAVDVIQAFVQCVVQWAEKKPCTFWDNMLLKKVWEQDPPDPHDPTQPTTVSVTGQQLTAVAGTAQATQLVGMLHDMQGQLWEALDSASAFLALSGLTYPGDRTDGPLYRQFTAVPRPGGWPHREEPDPGATYHRYPVSPLEQPAADVPYPAGSPPTITMIPEIGRGAPQVSLELFGQLAVGRADTDNLDLDADRGAGHPCWATDGSVHDDPIGVVVLGYGEQ